LTPAVNARQCSVPRALASASPAPPLAPARFIEDLRAVSPAAGRTFNVERLPDGRTTLVFRVTDEGRKADVAVSGPRTRAHFKHATGVVRAVMLQFKPGWSAPLLGVAASALTDRIVPLEELWGRAGADLALELLAARDLPDAIAHLTRALTLRAQAFEPASGRLARRAVRLLEAGETRVEQVAAQLGVTARHLRRAFTESIGVGPKDFARTIRLQRAVRSATSASSDWGRIAVDSGYYDQSHLIADFRQLLGLTPSAFLDRTSARRG
jgi:AraC-like DNA-binding protein